MPRFVRLAVLAAWSACAAGAEPITTPDRLQILLPLYSYPTWWTTYPWTRVAAAASRAPITAIINPDNGPGSAFPNADYVQGLNDLRAGGVRCIGYVYTSYGARALTNVLADIDAYTASTNVSGIFVDETSSSTNDLAYYTQVYAHVRSIPGFDLVVVNPGTQSPEAYLAAPAAEVAVIYEFNTGWSNYTPDAYVAAYPSGRFAALPYAIPDAAGMNHAVDLAVQRNIGYVYVTDDALPNPWDTLPTYWDELVDLVAAFRRTGGTGLAASNATAALSWSAPSNRPCVIDAAPAPDGAWNPASSVLTSGAAGVSAAVPATNGAAAYRLRLFP